MDTVNPFDSPDDDPVASPRVRPTQGIAELLSWGAAGAAAGTSVGGLTLTAGSMAVADVGAAAMVVGAALGGIALRAERGWAAGRPSLLDARGRPAWPLHGALFAAPVLVALPSLLLLTVLGSAWIGGPGPAVAFFAAAVAVGWAGIRVWSTHTYTTALAELEDGAVEQARAQLAGLARSWVATRSARTAARINLGMMALHEGRGDEALDWYVGLGGAWAQAGRALALLMLGRTEEAADELGDALGGPAARHLQEQLDALRVLLVWRTEGPDAARSVGQQLLGPQATPLHRALLVALGDRHWRDDPDVDALVHSGLGRALPELARVRVAVDV